MNKNRRIDRAQLAVNLAALPERVFIEHPLNPGEIVMIKRGEECYFTVEWRPDMTLEKLNSDITPVPDKAVLMAMQTGSMFGWDVKGAHPDAYPQLRSKAA